MGLKHLTLLLCALLALIGCSDPQPQHPLPTRALHCDAQQDPLPSPYEVQNATGLYLRGYAQQHVLSLTPSPNTTHLCLIACDLTTLPDTFLPTTLQHLWLSSNLLQALPETLQRCTALTYLNLDRNKLKRLPPLHTLPLRWLRLNDNQLSSLPPLPDTIERLYLANNAFRQITFKKPAHLKEVDLSYNPLTHLPDDFGAGLQRLDVAYTTLQTLPNDLSRWQTLRVLNLAGCPLSEEEKDRIQAAFDVNETTIIF